MLGVGHNRTLLSALTLAASAAGVSSSSLASARDISQATAAAKLARYRGRGFIVVHDGAGVREAPLVYRITPAGHDRLTYLQNNPDTTPERTGFDFGPLLSCF